MQESLIPSSNLPRMDGRARKFVGLAERGRKAHRYFSLQVNGLSTSYLSLLLVPLLQKTARTYHPSATSNTLSKPHLTIVTSSLHYEAKLPVNPEHDILPALNAKGGFEGVQRYMQTKLLEVLFVRSLSEHVERTAPGSVLINSVNPGFCHSNVRNIVL